MKFGTTISRHSHGHRHTGTWQCVHASALYQVVCTRMHVSGQARRGKRDNQARDDQGMGSPQFVAGGEERTNKLSLASNVWGTQDLRRDT